MDKMEGMKIPYILLIHVSTLKRLTAFQTRLRSIPLAEVCCEVCLSSRLYDAAQSWCEFPLCRIWRT